QHSTATIQQHAIELTDAVTNPIQTWIDVFEAADINIQSLVAQFQEYPFPVPQQVTANFLQYAAEYVQPYQQAGNAAVDYFLGTGNSDFVPLFQSGLTQAAAGNLTGAVSTLGRALWTTPLESIGLPLQRIVEILNPITQNLANATKYLTGTGLEELGLNFVIYLPQQLESGLGTGLQNVYDSWTAGDPLGAIINAIDIPGIVTNAVLNGNPAKNGTYSDGLISDSYGLAWVTGLYLPQQLAKSIVAPNAQNIMSGGSLSYALGYLANLVTTGFPTPQTVFDNLVNLLQYLFANPGAAAAATLPAADSIVGAFNSTDVLNGGSAMASLATELPGLPADVANVAGHLGADLASVLPGMILSILHF
ncbi:hypothetical protein BST29_24595, partial [Mycobacterium malmoense]